MFHPSYESWQIACSMMQNEKSRLKSYLQWYPFVRLLPEDWKRLSSENFYSTYIEEGSFVLVEEMRFVTRGYIQKQGSSLRESYLVSPVIYLYLLAYGIEYEQLFHDCRATGVCLYAGDLSQRQGHYRKSYKVFCDSAKYCAEQYSYCLKTDITNFFGSINIDSLMSKMQERSSNVFSSSDSLFIRSLLLYCGRGKFPVVQNHPTLSFLATKVYLADIDKALSERLSFLTSINRFELVRYVDDLYIFFDVADDADLLKVKYSLVNIYADLLREANLSLKQEKLALMDAADVLTLSAQISCVDFSGNNADEDIPVDASRIENLFLGLASAIDGREYTIEDFNRVLEGSFTFEELTTTPIAAFRQCLYKNDNLFKKQPVVSAIRKALEKGNVVLSFNTNEMVQAILKTRDEGLVKQLLNNLFVNSRSGSWCSLDSLAAITYLQHRGMQHRQLIELLEEHDAGLAKYCKEICWRDASSPALSPVEQQLVTILKEDVPGKIEFVSFLFNRATGNVFEMAAYYRSFFDRVSTYYHPKKSKKKNSWVWSKDELTRIYKDIPGATEVIERAERIRRQNPLVHAGGEIIERPTHSAELKEIVSSLSDLLALLLSSAKPQ